MSRIGTFKDLFESFLQEWLCVSAMETILLQKHYQHIADLYGVRKDAYLFLDRTTVCTVRDAIATSWRKETKYRSSTNGTELKEGTQEKKRQKTR